MTDALNTPFKRVLFKLSGEVLGDQALLPQVCEQLAHLQPQLSLVLVVGGGNVFRGRSSTYHNASPALCDGIGMCASMMNALNLCAELQERKLPVRVITPFPLAGLTKDFDPEVAEKDLRERRILVVGGGAGLPYVTTDTSAVLTALRARCEIVLKGSNVDGIFEADPKVKPDARFLPHLTYEDVRRQNLTPMDQTALALAETHRMPLRIFNLAHQDALVQVLEGKPPFSHVEQTKSHV